jgi:hypothetical protein
LLLSRKRGSVLGSIITKIILYPNLKQLKFIMSNNLNMSSKRKRKKKARAIAFMSKVKEFLTQ